MVQRCYKLQQTSSISDLISFTVDVNVGASFFSAQRAFYIRIICVLFGKKLCFRILDFFSSVVRETDVSRLWCPIEGPHRYHISVMYGKFGGVLNRDGSKYRDW